MSATLGFILLGLLGLSSAAGKLPTVDLGYSVYRATALNETGAYYNFSNIRYAAPPIGKLRFADPAPPLFQQTVQDGSVGYICFQSAPGYFGGAVGGLGDLIRSFPVDVSSQKPSEDCLFLDVMAPVKLFNAAHSTPSRLAPVLVNIHGGGFALGDKRTNYDPQGLLQQSRNGIVYVSMNYRLGAFGFLGGLKPSAENVTSPNAGLLDQRFALKWVQQHIHLFGGDAKRVTIIGQSAGGGSVEFHTTAYGGRRSGENSLFIGAIAQSPAPIIVDPKWQALGADTFLRAAGSRSVKELRTLPSDTLQAANLKGQALAPYTLEIFAPSVDGQLIPDLPSRLYSQGRYIKNLHVMAAHQANEGRLFANLSVATNADYDYWVQQNFLSSSPRIRSFISNDLYPPVYDGSQPYKSPLERMRLTTQEYVIACNAVAIGKAYKSTAFNYNFGLPPAIHSQDLLYTYNRGGSVSVNGSSAFDTTVSIQMQTAFTQFTKKGSPNGPGLVEFPLYDNRSEVLNFSPSGPQVIREPADNSRCAWWLQAPYAPKPQ